MRRISLMLSLLAGLAACSSQDKNTKIVVVVWSDLAVPTEMDRIEIDAQGPTAASQPKTFSLATGDDLPAVLVLVPPNNQELPFSVTANGLLGGSTIPVVSQMATVSFLPGQSRVLTLFLGRSCPKGLCAQLDVDPHTLPVYNPKAAFLPPDAGAGARLDGGGDVGAADVGGTETNGVEDGGPTGDGAVDMSLPQVELAAAEEPAVALEPAAAEVLAAARLRPAELGALLWVALEVSCWVEPAVPRLLTLPRTRWSRQPTLPRTWQSCPVAIPIRFAARETLASRVDVAWLARAWASARAVRPVVLAAMAPVPRAIHRLHLRRGVQRVCTESAPPARRNAPLLACGAPACRTSPKARAIAPRVWTTTATVRPTMLPARACARWERRRPAQWLV